MQFGIHLPHHGEHASPDNIRQFAQRAEELGYDSLWVSDHVVVPRAYQSRYPYNPSGVMGIGPDTPLLEPLATLCFVAACTERVRLGTTVLVVPMRNPVLQAKLVASLDVLSKGRVIFGAGVGWLAEEFAALDVPFEHRGARMDEYLEVMRRLWTLEDPSYEGKYYRLGNVGFTPRPVQQPHPPVWIGGNTEPALRRAARLGDAWHAAGLEAEAIAECAARLRRYAEAAGREPSAIAVTGRIGLRLRPGEENEELARIRRFQEAGVSHLVLEVGTRDLDLAYSRMERFARDLLPALA